MKTTFKLLTVLTVCSVIILSGCESDITSSGKSTNNEQNVSENKKPVNATSLMIKLNLNPNQTYSLNYTNTGYRAFYSLNIENCTEANKLIEIIGYADDELILLNCSSSNLYVFSIDIKNISPKPIEIYLSVTGTKNIIKTYNTPGF